MNILLVDDDRVTNFLNQRTIDGWEKCTKSIIASDGNEAIEKLSELSFDLILTDINMPGMGGWELIEKLKSSNFTGKIICFVPDEDDKGKERAQALNIPSISKPLTIEKLTTHL